MLVLPFPLYLFYFLSRSTELVCSHLLGLPLSCHLVLYIFLTICLCEVCIIGQILRLITLEPH